MKPPFQRFMASTPTNSEVQAQQWLRQGIALHQQGRLAEAKDYYERVLKIRSRHFDALHMLGVLAYQEHDAQRAIELIRKAIAIRSDIAPAYNNLGNAYVKLNNLQAAADCYGHAIRLQPRYAEAYNNLGNTFANLRLFESACESFRLAIQCRPDYVQAHYGLGNALMDMRDLEGATACYDRVYELKPDAEFLIGIRLHARMHMCLWSGFQASVEDLARKVEAGYRAAQPFQVLSIIDSPQIHRRSAEVLGACNDYPMRCERDWDVKHPVEGKIRLGYYSGDFGTHPVSLLSIELFETHDRERFEIIGFSFRANVDDVIYQRMAKAFDKFIDASAMSDEEVARLSREMGVSIAINLGGYTNGHRTGVFALRAAPIQVNYLGYPGTMAADFMDYLIADDRVVPVNQRPFFKEKIAYMPHSFMPHDSKQSISERQFLRQEFGLPEVGFVFCCFNNYYKIHPAIFNIWMRLLRAIDGSVLWLSDGHESAKNNLRQEAQARGVAPERLIFAKRMDDMADHLGRHQLADLFVDTLPYNAHTTACDALWAGLPVLTCMGEAFPSRVAGSLLHALGLPELVTGSQQEYEAKALELAKSPGRLKEIRCKLEKNRGTAPLFNSVLYRKNLESAYMFMYERYKNQLEPATFEIECKELNTH